MPVPAQHVIEIEVGQARCPQFIGELYSQRGRRRWSPSPWSREGAQLSEDDLRAFAAEHLADYEQPHIYRFVAQLPRTRNGKVQPGILAQELLHASDATRGNTSSRG